MELKLYVYVGFISVFCSALVSAIVNKGCFGSFKPDGRNRYFGLVPGSMAASPAKCATLCGSLKHVYASLTQGKFCFCGDIIPPDSVKDSSGSSCDLPCVDDPTQICGGQKHSSVYSTSEPISGLVLSCSKTLAATGDSVTFTPRFDSAGSDVTFTIDYGDDGDRSPKNQTNMFSKEFYVPKTYHVTVAGNDQNDTLVEKLAQCTTEIDAKIQNVTIDCPSMIASYEDGKCSVYVQQGSYIRLDIVENGVPVISSLSLADPLVYTTGPGIPRFGPGISGEGTGTIVMPATEFQRDAVLTGFELYAETAGNIEIYILEPDCGVQKYCFNENTCSSNCSPPFQTLCPSSPFCLSTFSCFDDTLKVCPQNTRYDGTQKTNLKIIKTISRTVSGGQEFIDVSNEQAEVSPGCVLGYKPLVGKLRAKSSTASLTDVQTSDVTNKASQSALSANKRHLLRAVYVSGTKFDYEFNYKVAEVKNLEFYVRSDRLSLFENVTKTITVNEGIDRAVTDIPTYWKTNTTLTFKTLPHTGNAVTYYWTFGDGDIENTTLTSFPHTYTIPGTYTVSVTLANAISSKSNTTEIKVEDEIIDLQLGTDHCFKDQVCNLALQMTSGSDYTCTWTEELSSTTNTFTTTSVETPPNSSHKRKFTILGLYKYTVRCVNNVSQMTATQNILVQEKIEGLKLLKGGALTGEDFYVEFTWETGSDMTFFLEFDGNVLSNLVIDKSQKYGRNPTLFGSRANSILIPLNLTVYNSLSSQKIETNFAIIEKIVNCVVTPTVQAADYVILEKSDTFGVSVKMDAGTQVTVTWNWGDNTEENAVVSDWSSGQVESKTHTYSSYGQFDVIVTVSNYYDVIVNTYKVHCIARVPASLSVTASPTNLLLAPPGAVTFTFSVGVGDDLPTEASMLFDFKEIQFVPEAVNFASTYTHEYRENGVFTPTVNVSNAINFKQVTVSTPITIVDKIEDIEILPDPAHCQKGGQVNVGVKMRRGDPGITLKWTPGDGQSPITATRIGTSPYGIDWKTITYPTVGTYPLKVSVISSYETVEQTYSLSVQVPVDITKLTFVAQQCMKWSDTNGVSDSSVQYDGTELPTDATIDFDFGDGQSHQVYNLNTFLTGLGVLKSTSHTYATDGNYYTTLRIHNKVSDISTSLHTAVVKPFKGCQVTTSYRPLVPTNSGDLPGLGNSKNIYNIDLPVVFKTTCTEGTYEYYDIIAISTNNIDILACNKTTEGRFELDFPATGTYNVHIDIKNCQYTQTLTTTVVVSDPVVNAQIDSTLQNTAANEIKTFNITYDKEGYNSCFFVDFGDGQNETYGTSSTCSALFPQSPYQSTPLSSPMVIQHNFTTDGQYAIRLKAVNDFVELDSEVSHVVSTADCTFPNIDIIDKDKLFYDIKDKNTFTKCQSVRVRGDTIINCNSTFDNTKKWRIFMVNQYNGSVVREIDVSGLGTSTTSELVLLPRFLEEGVYKVTYNMTMMTDMPSSAEVTGFIKIVKCELIAAIFQNGASFVEVGPSTDITIAPYLHSYDPGLSSGEKQVFDTFKWTCREESEPDANLDTLQASRPYYMSELSPLPVNNGGCFRQGPGPIDTNKGLLVFNTLNMEQGKTYVFKVKVYKDDRMAENEARLSVLSYSPPNVTISCVPGTPCSKTTTGLRIIPSTRLALNVTCSGNPQCVLGTRYYWRIYYPDHITNPWKEIIQISDFMQGRESDRVKIMRTLFSDDLYKNFSKFLVSVEVTLPNNIIGKTKTILHVNNPPFGGACTVSPSTGTVLNTEFRITCSNWEDQDGIFQYSFYATLTNDLNNRKGIAFGSDPSCTAKLGMGNPDNNHKMKIWVTISDTLGSFLDYEIGEIQVNPLSTNDAESLLNTLLNDNTNDIQRAAENGDINTVCQNVNSLSTVFSEASKTARTEYDDAFLASTKIPTQQGSSNVLLDPSTQTEVNETATLMAEKQRNKIERAATNAIIALSKLPNTNPDGILQKMSVVSTMASQIPDSLSREGQNKLFEGASVMIDDFISMYDAGLQVTEEQAILMKQFAENLFEARTAGYSVNRENPTQTDREWTQKTLIETDPEAYDTYDKTEQKEISLEGNSDNQLTSIVFEDTVKEENGPMVIKQHQQMDKIRLMLSRMMTPNSDPIVTNTPIQSTILEKDAASSISGKSTQIGEAKVTLPDLKQVPSIGLDEVVLVDAQYSVYKQYDDTKKSTGVDHSIGTFTLNLKTDNNRDIQVQDLADPFEFFIPRNARYKTVPQVKAAFIPDNDWDHLFYVSMNVNKKGASLSVKVNFDNDTMQLLAVARRGALPNITTGEIEFSTLLPYAMTDAGTSGTNTKADPYTFFISGDELNYQGKVYVGFRVLEDREQDKYYYIKQIPKFAPRTGYFPEDFKINVTSVESICEYYEAITKEYESDGCYSGQLTNEFQLHCKCNHLTTFSGTWVVAPNTIDWNLVFSNLDFAKNPTLYITEIVILVLYIVAAIWARRQDKRDVNKLGLTPLMDNDKNDKYYYEIVVVTGMRRNAGTESKVSFILSGENETEVRSLVDSKRKILKRGAVDGFLMAVSRPLGPLSYLHIWHDNSGKGAAASWYLRSFVVRDVQTDEKYIFICNRWLAVEEDDGMIDRIIPVAGKEQMTEFSHLFSERTSKSLSDGHLWFSVVARPPQSRFTRLQRVSCCLCLLYVSMLANALFTGKEEGATNALELGPFSLSMSQIYIGFVSNLIVFPVNFLIIFLFRRSRPRKLRPSRVAEAIKITRCKTATSMTDVNPTIRSPTSTTFTPNEIRPMTSFSRPQTSMSVTDLAEACHEEKKKKKKLEFPWYFTIIAWVLLWVATLTAAAFVTFYGVTFQDEKCKKWITSMIVSFITSIFITQPIKVFATAIFFSLIIKNPGGGEDEEFDEEKVQNPKLNDDEEFLHSFDDAFGAAKPKRVGYVPVDTSLLSKAREIRMKEIQMWAVIREIVFYSFFLWILMVISYQNRSTDMYQYKYSMEQIFIVTNNTNYRFEKLKNAEDFWIWAKSGLINGIQAGVWYNNDFPFFLRGYTNDKVSRILGYATMRQLRIRSETCRIADKMLDLIPECNAEYGMSMEDRTTYRVGWQPMTDNDTLNANTSVEWRYSSADELDGFPFWGEMGIYSGGGYVVELKGNKKTLREKMAYLQKTNWIDKYTRAIFVEFTTYNPSVNLFSIATLLAEFRPSNGIFPSYRFEPATLLPYMNGVLLFQLACEIIYLLFTIFFVVTQTRTLYRQKCAYFKEFWNLVEMAICIMSVSATVIYFYRMVIVSKLTGRFRDTGGDGYVKFQYAGYWTEVFTYIIAFLVFFGTLKFLKLLRFNKRICLLASTLKASCRDLLHFSVIFNITFMAFIQLFYLTYVANINGFKTFIQSFESGIVMMMGKFEIYSMLAVNPVITQVFLFLYVVCITFIVVNMFLSILNDTFMVVRQDVAKQANDYEIVDFMIGRFKLWTGLGTPTTNTLKPEDLRMIKQETLEGKITNFPDRIDRLLSSISHVYMEKERIDAIFEMNAPGKRGGAFPYFQNLRDGKYSKKDITQVQTH